MEELVEGVAKRLPGRRGTRVYRDTLMQLVVEVQPELATAPDRAHRLAEVLERLEERGILRPSKGRSAFLGVDLPVSVQVVGDEAPRGLIENPARRYPWVPEMGWAAAGPRRTAREHQRLVRLSEWLASERDGERHGVPVRERSLQVFGEDKVLDTLLDGVLNGHRETVEALAIERVHPPMAVRQIAGASGKEVLVVENHTTFHSAVAALRAHVAAGTPVRFGYVGYGAGGQLEAILPSLRDLEPEGLEYFGDLDPEGLVFAAAGARSCHAAGLPELRPAAWLYASLLERGRPQTKATRRGQAKPWPEHGLAWLGPTLTKQLLQTLVEGQWLAQEWVGVEVLWSDPTWCQI